MAASSTRLAVLDDYAGIAAPHFEGVPDLAVDSWAQTLDPKKAMGLQKLVHRLGPYAVISTMRERTPMPQALLMRLPNLKLLLTTGVRNASIDLAYCKERGIIVAGTTGTRPKKYDAEGHPIHDYDSNNDDSTPAPPTPGYDSTTQHAWSLLLSLTSHIPLDDTRLHTDPSSWQSGLTIPLLSLIHI